jgi:hypothetical protein
MNTNRKTFAYTITTILLTALFALAAAAQDNGTVSNYSSRGLPGSNPLALIGTWEVQATLGPCGGGTPQQYSKMVSFNPGGTAVEVSTGAPSAVRTAALGVWENIGNNSFQYAFRFFIFTPTGVHAATTNAKWLVTMSDFNDSYTAEAQVQVVPTNGAPPQILCGTETATRYAPF